MIFYHSCCDDVKWFEVDAHQEEGEKERWFQGLIRADNEDSLEDIRTKRDVIRIVIRNLKSVKNCRPSIC